MPKRMKSRTLKKTVHCICNNYTTTMCAHPIGPGNTLSPSKTAKNCCYNWQLLRIEYKLQKPLQACTRKYSALCNLSPLYGDIYLYSG